MTDLHVQISDVARMGGPTARRLGTLLTVFLLTAVPAGCSSGSTNTSTTSPAPSSSAAVGVTSPRTLDLEGATGPVVLNLANGGHEAQLDPVLELSAVADTTRMKADIPEFSEAVSSVIGSTTYEQITSHPPVSIGGVTYSNGEEAAQGQILAACQKIAGTVGGAQQIVAVEFTVFVMQ